MKIVYIKSLAQENSYEVQYGIIRQAYISTYEKYDYMQAHGALYNLVHYGQIDNFTDAQGCRTLLEQKVLGNNIINILRQNIADSNTLDDKSLLKIAEKEFMRGIQLQQ